MRVIYLDSDEFDFETAGSFASAERSDRTEISTEDALVVLVGVERTDVDGTESILDNAVRETTALQSNLQLQSIVLVSWPHLVDDPLPPRRRSELLGELESELAGACPGESVFRIPVGHRGPTELSIRGHSAAITSIRLS